MSERAQELARTGESCKDVNVPINYWPAEHATEGSDHDSTIEVEG